MRPPKTIILTQQSIADLFNVPLSTVYSWGRRKKLDMNDPKTVFDLYVIQYMNNVTRKEKMKVVEEVKPIARRIEENKEIPPILAPKKKNFFS